MLKFDAVFCPVEHLLMLYWKNFICQSESYPKRLLA